MLYIIDALESKIVLSTKDSKYDDFYDLIFS